MPLLSSLVARLLHRPEPISPDTVFDFDEPEMTYTPNGRSRNGLAFVPPNEFWFSTISDTFYKSKP